MTYVVDIKMLSSDDRYVHSFNVVIYRIQAERVLGVTYGLQMSDIDLLCSKEIQTTIMVKLNILTLNGEGLHRSKD